MGNYISHSPSGSAGKVVLSDGTVHEFDVPLTVAELMLEHPQQVVVEFESAVNGKRPSPLPADKKLDMDKVYLMLPMRRGKQPALSSEEARQLLSVANSVSNRRSFLSLTTGFLPLFARICNGGSREGGEFVSGGKENSVGRRGETTKVEYLPEILEGRPEYLSKQFSGKGWKPSLDTIKEKIVKKKVPHWLL
ncbi:hypothetical protein ACSBR2_031687 [Camellia fascicularis]